MLAQKLPFGIDWKHKTFYIYHDNDEAEQIIVDENGSGELLLDMFKLLNMKPLREIIDQIDELVTKEQRQSIFQLWGNSNQIMLSDMTRIVDRTLAKKILALGMDMGVLGRGVNSTWKVLDKETQKTMKESAIKMKRGPIKRLTTEESIERVQKQGFTVGEGGMISNESKDTNTINEESTHEVIPEEPIKKNEVDIPLLRKELEKIEKQINDPEREDNEACSIHTLLDRRKVLKVQITNAEIVESNRYFNKGMNITPSGSVTRVQRAPQVVVSSAKQQEPKMIPMSMKKIPSKGKPAPCKGVGSSKKPATR